MNKYQRQRNREIRQIMRKDKWGLTNYEQARRRWERTVGPNRYKEIVQLYRFCRQIGICTRLEQFFDGYAIRFPRAKFGDFVQHNFSHGSTVGRVEPAINCSADYTGISLVEAKALVQKHKDRLNGGTGNAK